jgi:hypothetical protein
VDASLGAGIALNADCLTRSLARPSVGLRTLTANGQAAQVADATVAFDGLKALQIETEFASQISFDHIPAVLNGMHDQRELSFCQVFGPNRRINVGASQDVDRILGSNAVDIAKRNVDSLLARNFNTDDTCHSLCLTLTLFVPSVAANDANDALAPHDFAVFAKFFY